VAATAAISADSGGADKFTIPNGRTAVGIEVYGPTIAVTTTAAVAAGAIRIVRYSI